MHLTFRLLKGLNLLVICPPDGRCCRIQVLWVVWLAVLCWELFVKSWALMLRSLLFVLALLCWHLQSLERA